MHHFKITFRCPRSFAGVPSDRELLCQSSTAHHSYAFSTSNKQKKFSGGFSVWQLHKQTNLDKQNHFTRKKSACAPESNGKIFSSCPSVTCYRWGEMSLSNHSLPHVDSSGTTKSHDLRGWSVPLQSNRVARVMRNGIAILADERHLEGSGPQSDSVKMKQMRSNQIELNHQTRPVIVFLQTHLCTWDLYFRLVDLTLCCFWKQWKIPPVARLLFLKPKIEQFQSFPEFEEICCEF